MRGYMDHRRTAGAEQENPFLACLPPDNSEAARRAREVVARCVECNRRCAPFDYLFWLTCFETRQHPDPAWATVMGFDNYSAGGGRCVNAVNEGVPDDHWAWADRQCRTEGYHYGDHSCLDDPKGQCEALYGQPCPPPVPDGPSDDPLTGLAQTSCAKLRGGAEAAEESELCKVIHTYREEGCTGGRECIKREVEWKPCRQPTLIQRFKGLARTLFEYLCEKECTPDGEVRCKLREDRRTAFGVRG